MRRTLTIIILFLFSFNVFAQADSNLARIMEEYQYDITVGWDQKDQSYLKAKDEELEIKLRALVAQENFSPTELETYLRSNVKNQKKLEEMLQVLKLQSESRSKEFVVNYLQRNSKELFVKGAAWNPEDIQSALFITGLLAATALLTWFLIHLECVDPVSGNPAYETTTTCGGYSCTTTTRDVTPVYCAGGTKFNP